MEAALCCGVWRGDGVCAGCGCGHCSWDHDVRVCVFVCVVAALILIQSNDYAFPEQKETSTVNQSLHLFHTLLKAWRAHPQDIPQILNSRQFKFWGDNTPFRIGTISRFVGIIMSSRVRNSRERCDGLGSDSENPWTAEEGNSAVEPPLFCK